MPQGAVSSPLLWNFFTSGLDAKGYADDFHALSVSPEVDKLTDELNAADAELLAWTGANYVDLCSQVDCNPLHAVDQASQHCFGRQDRKR